jgi:hypothetical protein
MQRRGVRPDVVAFTSVLAAVKASSAAAPLAASLWASMLEAGVRPNGFAFSAYLDILLARDDIEATLELLGDAARALDSGQSGGGYIPPPALYAHALDYAAQRNDVGAAERLARHMRSVGVLHTPATLGALLTAQAVRRSCSAAKWLLQAAHSPPERSDVEAWEVSDAVFEACLLGNGDAEGVVAAAAEGNFACGVGEALAVLGGLAVRSKPAQALRWYCQATSGGVDQNNIARFNWICFLN